MGHQRCFAAIADVHGNRWALEAVLADIRSRSITTIVNLGDDLYGPLDLHETAALISKISGQRVQGNCDRRLVETDEIDSSSTLAHNRATLAADERQWLAGAPKTAFFEDILLCHGTPWRDDEYLLWKPATSGAVLRTEDELRHLLQLIEYPVILCAHSHTPLTRKLLDGRLIVNVGSVGMPAYADETPFPHTMQSGSPHARYAILTRTNDGWTADHIPVLYDWDSAATYAEGNGRPDWAAWLRSGTA